MMGITIRKLSACILLLSVCALCIQLPATATVIPVSPAAENSMKIQEVTTEIGENYVRYPQISGMQNVELQQSINNAVVNEADIAQRLVTLATLQQGGTGLQVIDSNYLHNQLLSVVISAKGMMESFRSGHQYTALAFDLQNGNRLRLSDFFADPDAAIAWMEAQLTDYADDLSNYLEFTGVAPLPVDSFSFDAYGITFYYPYQQFALLSEYSGSVQFQYGELQNFLIRDEGAVPDRLDALIPQYSNTQIKENIEAIVADGTLPNLPVSLDDSLSDLIARYRLARTPDQYPGGRYFQLEAAPFRQVILLSDVLTQSWESSVVEGLLATRMNLYGLQTGVTQRDRWHQILGEPSASVAFDSYIAADYGLPVGTADYYTISDRQLMLYADENNMLHAVRLAK